MDGEAKGQLDRQNGQMEKKTVRQTEKWADVWRKKQTLRRAKEWAGR